MRHQVRQSFDELRIGDEIKLTWSTHPLEITSLDASRHLITGKHWDGVDPPPHFTTDPRGMRTVTWSEYDGSLLTTMDYRQAADSLDLDSKTWVACEKHYGINHTGSNDPDKLRQLAFAILNGSAVAISKALADLPESAIASLRRPR